MVKLSKRDLTIIAGVLGAIDFAYEGALTKPVSRAVKATIRAGAAKAFLNPGQIPTNRALASSIGRGALRTLPRIGGTALRVGKTIALRHPILTAGAVAYYTIKNRDEIEDIIRDGYEVLSDVELPGAERRRDFASDPVGFVREVIDERPGGYGPGGLIRPLPSRVPKIRRKTKFNKAVSAGMKAVKASTSYGKKGTISNSKKAFAAVTKTASKINKGAKVAKSGITRKIGLAVKRIL